MTRTATRTASIYTRVDPETKEQAEMILDQLGIPMSNAIGMFLKQVVLQRGLPFEMKLPPAAPIAMADMNSAQFARELEKGVEDIRNRRVASAEDVEEEMRKQIQRS